MSNPLAALRKRQKVLLAVFGVMIMFAFVVGPSVQTYFTQDMQSARGGETVVTWKNGSVGQYELENMRAQRGQLIDFIEELFNRTLQQGGQPRAMPVTYGDSPEHVLQTILLAERARELGVMVSDEAIKDYLHDLTDGEFEEDEGQLLVILRQTSHGTMTEDELFEQLRMGLLAQTMRLMALRGVEAVPPSLAWDYYQRLHRRVTAELLPIDAQQFVDKVKNPGAEELQAFYDKYKDQFSYPELPDPGFKRRKKIAFQYFEVDFNKFLDQAMAELSPEEVQKYYEENKQDFRQLELPSQQPAVTPDVSETVPPATEQDSPPAETATPAPESDVPTTDDPDQPEQAQTPAASAQPPVTTPSNAEAEQEVPNAPAEGETPTDATPEGESSPGPDEQAQRDQARVFFTALQAEQAEQAEPLAQPETSQPAESQEGQEAEPPPSEAAQPAEPEAPADPVQQPASETETAQQPPASQPANETATGDQPGTPETKYKPLEEVEEGIRRILASPVAQQRQDEAIAAARRPVDRYQRQYQRWVATGQEGEKPEPPDFASLAQANQLEFDETPLVDELEVTEFEIGQAAEFSFAGGRVSQIPFADLAYRDGIAMYRTQELGRVDYLWWKKDQREAFVPPLKEIRPEVIRAWKLAAAFGLAKQHGQRLAEQARKADKPLPEAFPQQTDKIFTTEPFTWLTRGSVASGVGQPMLSNLASVPMAGGEFMKDVFALEVGRVGVAENQPRTIVYVARVVDQSPSPAELRQQFLASGGLTRDVRMLAFEDRVALFRQWYEDLEEELNVQWQTATAPEETAAR